MYPSRSDLGVPVSPTIALLGFSWLRTLALWPTLPSCPPTSNSFVLVCQSIAFLFDRE